MNYTYVYIPTTLLPANGLLGVFCKERGEDEITLWTAPLDFVGLADMETRRWQDGRQIGETDVDRGIFIGIQIEPDGGTDIVNGACNFCGFAKPGDDLADLNLPHRYSGRKLVAQ